MAGAARLTGHGSGGGGLLLVGAAGAAAPGFAEDVERILSDTPEYKQVALFSATMPPAIRKITAKYLHDPFEVTSEAKTATAENISQRYIQVAGPRKMDALTRVLEVEPFEAMIVFVRTKQATEEVAERLRARGFSAAAINGDIPQAQRGSATCSRRSRRPHAKRLSRPSCPLSRTSTHSGWRNSPIPSPTRSAVRARAG
jgi:ATP-dependent RNA helicase DeaD